MYGTILGDIIGSPYEFDMGKKTKDFPFFDEGCMFTDDTVMTIALADALMSVDLQADDETVKSAIVDAFHRWGKKYPGAGYGSRFSMWLYLEDREPYNSFGNGAAMRVAPAGWMEDTLESVRRLARLSAEVTHNHPEGIKGAEATASAIFLSRKKYSKEQIKAYICEEFGYDLSRPCDEIRPNYRHVESCQQTVPEAITAFLEGESFEDVICTAVSLGGDCDTLTAIAGSIAEAYYGVPDDLKMECYVRLERDLRDVLDTFGEKYLQQEKLAYRYGPLSDDPMTSWDFPEEEPLIGMKWEKTISCAEGKRLRDIGNRYLREEVKLGENLFAWRGTKRELENLVASLSKGNIEDEKELQEGVEYGVILRGES